MDLLPATSNDSTQPMFITRKVGIEFCFTNAGAPLKNRAVQYVYTQMVMLIHKGSFFRLVGGIASCALFLTVAVWGSNNSYGANSVPPGPTLVQLVSYASASSHLTRGPNVLTSIPPLVQAASNIPNFLPAKCYSTSTTTVQSMPSNAATACAFGDTNASQTILLFGDSQAAMWVPALNIAGEILHWKIVFVAKVGCGPWIDPANEGITACNQWVKGEIALANQLKPQVVLPVGLTTGWRNNRYPTRVQFDNEIKSMVKALTPSRAKVLFFDEIPQYYSSLTSATPATCLTVHSSSIQSCELTIKQVMSIWTTKALNVVADADHLSIVPVRQFFCGKTRCDLFVNAPNGSHLIYSDWAHMNADYSAWIGPATAKLLARYLPG